MILLLKEDIFTFEYKCFQETTKTKIKKNEVVLVVEHSKINSLYYRYLIFFNEKFYEIIINDLLH